MAVFECDACGRTKQRTRSVPFAVRFEAGEATRFLNVIQRKGMLGKEDQLQQIARTLADESGDKELRLSCCRPCRDAIDEAVSVGDVQVFVQDALR